MVSPEMGNAPAVNRSESEPNTKRFTENHSHTDQCQFATTPNIQVCLSEIGAGSTSPRYEVYLFGWIAGRDSLTAELERVRWERDLWYFVANNKGKRPTDFYSHATKALWAEAVAA